MHFSILYVCLCVVVSMVPHWYKQTSNVLSWQNTYNCAWGGFQPQSCTCVRRLSSKLHWKEDWEECESSDVCSMVEVRTMMSTTLKIPDPSSLVRIRARVCWHRYKDNAHRKKCFVSWKQGPDHWQGFAKRDVRPRPQHHDVRPRTVLTNWQLCKTMHNAQTNN